MAGALDGTEDDRLIDRHRCGFQRLHQSLSGRRPELLGGVSPPFDRPVQNIGGEAGTCHAIKGSSSGRRSQAIAHSYARCINGTLLDLTPQIVLLGQGGVALP